jgi:glycosyltransferase involved in cell wall biosynthesis
MIRVDWLITGLNTIGGAEVFTTQLALHMSSNGIQLRVITLRTGGDLITFLRNNGIPVIEIGLNHKYNPLPLLRLYNLWRKDPPCIIHTHLYHAGVIGRLIARLANIHHVIVHQHGTENNRSAFRSMIDRFTSIMVDRYVVPSNAVGDMLTRREHIAQSKIHLINYGINIDNPILSAPILNWPAPADLPIIGCVSRLVREKSHPVLLRALQLLRKQGIPFHAIMIGDGPERNNLEDLSRHYDLTGCVSWVGTQRNISSWLSRFDIFVLPSAWEGLPISILEAMAAKLPVVATAVGGTSEAVLTDQTGILVPPGDPERLFHGIYRLILDASLRAKMGQAGYLRVTEHFSINQTINNVLELYTELIDKSPQNDILSQ